MGRCYLSTEAIFRLVSLPQGQKFISISELTLAVILINEDILSMKLNMRRVSYYGLQATERVYEAGSVVGDGQLQLGDTISVCFTILTL